MMTVDTTNMCSHLQKKLFEEDGVYHRLWIAMQDDPELTAVVRSRQLHIYRNGKKVLALAGKSAPKIIREDKICEMLQENANHRGIQLVIFDFDGTLGDTRGTIVATMQQTIAELHLSEKSDEECAATIGLTLKNCFRQLFPQLSDEEVERCAEVYRRVFEVNKLRYKPVLFPHVKETLIWLHEQGIRMTVASSRTTFSLHDLLDALSIANFFDYVLGSEDVTHPKPDPEPVLKTLEKMNVDAARTLVVGDMAVDIIMDARAGCKTCGVTYGNGTAEELTQSGAEFIINDMAELVGIVK